MVPISTKLGMTPKEVTMVALQLYPAELIFTFIVSKILPFTAFHTFYPSPELLFVFLQSIVLRDETES